MSSVKRLSTQWLLCVQTKEIKKTELNSCRDTGVTKMHRSYQELPGPRENNEISLKARQRPKNNTLRKRFWKDRDGKELQ